MAFTKTTASKQYAKHETDTGSSAVQVAVLTERINYLQRTDLEAYRKLVSELGLRY